MRVVRVTTHGWLPPPLAYREGHLGTCVPLFTLPSSECVIMAPYQLSENEDDAPTGKKVLLVGMSGSGKSSMESVIFSNFRRT